MRLLRLMDNRERFSGVRFDSLADLDVLSSARQSTDP